MKPLSREQQLERALWDCLDALKTAIIAHEDVWTLIDVDNCLSDWKAAVVESEKVLGEK